jgi:hypothetical protein
LRIREPMFGITFHDVFDMEIIKQESLKLETIFFSKPSIGSDYCE